jgi:ubiquinone/menaquinone biosynthesis C-methylase UbiE
MTELGELTEAGGSAALVASAYELGLVESLARPASAEEHAERLRLDPEATMLALDALAALGIATESDGRFGASERLSLDASQPSSELWSHLPLFLRTGERPGRMDGSVGERSAAYEDLVSALGDMFEEAAQALAAKLPPAGARILDVGAGSGVWSLAMCERTPRARVTALDLPNVLPAFLARAESLGLSERVDSIAGDYQSVDLPAHRFDRVILANVLHLETPERANSLIARVAPALRPGGKLVVIDALAEGDAAADRSRSIYALHLAMRTREGRVHSRDEIERWCRDAGLESGELVTVDAPPHLLAALVHRAP